MICRTTIFLLLGLAPFGSGAQTRPASSVDPVEFVDTRNNKRAGTKKLVPVLTVKGGRPFGRPYPVPFGY